MDRISQIVNTMIVPGAVAFYGSAFSAIVDKPISAAILFSFAVLAAALARSLIILAATFIFALLALLASSDANGGEEFAATALGITSLTIMCAWTLAIRERFARLKARLKSVLAEHASTKDLLDREIAWRQAADDELS